MRKICHAIVVFAVAGCSGLALDTRVADTATSRQSIAASVIPGTTTETALVTRWGRPVQKVRRGGQVEYIYRSIYNPARGVTNPIFGDSSRYVIVTFQYGTATAVRTSDEIACRATFPPRPPGYLMDNPSQVRLAGSCAPYDARTEAGAPGQGEADGSGPGFVTDDSYVPGGKSGRARETSR